MMSEPCALSSVGRLMSRSLRAAYPTFNPPLQTALGEAQLSRTDAYSKGPLLGMTGEVICADAQTRGSLGHIEEPVRRRGLPCT
jgi:hypothetical protein